MQTLAGKKILLGISGGIAAYKCAELTRRLIERGAQVQVVMTTAAQEFITPLTMQAVSGNPVSSSLLDPSAEASMGHIELAKWADLVLLAPATGPPPGSALHPDRSRGRGDVGPSQTVAHPAQGLPRVALAAGSGDGAVHRTALAHRRASLYPRRHHGHLERGDRAGHARDGRAEDASYSAAGGALGTSASASVRSRRMARSRRMI